MYMCGSHCAPAGLNDCGYLCKCPSACSFICDCRWFIGSSTSECLGVFCDSVYMSCIHESMNLCYVWLFSHNSALYLHGHADASLWDRGSSCDCLCAVYIPLYATVCVCVCVPIVLISVCIFVYLCTTVCGSRGSGCMTVSKSVQPQRFYVESSVHPGLCPRVLKSNKTVATGMCPGVDGRVQLLFYTDVEVWSCERYLIENILCKVFTQI